MLAKLSNLSLAFLLKIGWEQAFSLAVKPTPNIQISRFESLAQVAGSRLLLTQTLDSSHTGLK